MTFFINCKKIAFETYKGWKKVFLTKGVLIIAVSAYVDQCSAKVLNEMLTHT